MSKFLAVLLLTLFNLPALAQDPSTDSAVAAVRSLPVLWLFVALGIAYVTRRRAVGGWLFYFYMTMFGSMAVSMLLVFPSLSTLAEDGWDAFYWWMAVLDLIPWLIATVLTWFFGIRLLFKKFRSTNNLKAMRYAMVSVLLFSIVRVVITFRVFPNDPSLVQNFIGLITSTIWCFYWLFSKRVTYVMTLGNESWNYKEFKESISAKPNQ